MKEYIKPEVEYVDFASEEVMGSSGAGDGTMGTGSSNVVNPWD